MSLSMNELGGLGDHMRVGPQFIPPAHEGVQVIQRGPHGAWLAPPLGKYDGRLRWWGETISNEPWTPQQRVTGVLGMGERTVNDVIADRVSAAFRDDREAPRETKERLTHSSRTLAKMARSLSVGDKFSAQAIVSAANSGLAELKKWIAFKADSWLQRGDWDGSQTIRSNLFLAMQVAKAKAAGQTPSASAQEPVKDNTDVRPDYTQGVGDRARELAEGNLCTPEMLRVPLFGAALCKGRGEPRFTTSSVVKYALIAGGAYLAGQFLVGAARSAGRRAGGAR